MRSKRKISELETSLSPKPLFRPHLAIQTPKATAAITPNTTQKVKKTKKLLNGARSYVTVNINRRLGIIKEIMEIYLYLRNLSQRIASVF